MRGKKTFSLLFVYNANAGFGNSILDSAHKIISPNTYKCSLCAMTFGVFSERKAWKKFRTETNLSLEFLHKDEFQKKYRNDEFEEFPLVLKVESQKLSVFLSAKELNKIEAAEALVRAIESRF